MLTPTDLDPPKPVNYLTFIYTISKMIVGFLFNNFTIHVIIYKAKRKL